MALTIRQLIKKLEKVEDKSGDVYIEFPSDFFSLDRVILDSEGDITLVSEVESHHCLCTKCHMNETEL